MQSGFYWYNMEAAGRNETCSVQDDFVICNGTLFTLPERKLNYTDNLFWIYIGLYTGLVLFAGLVSGLTMGLLSIDTTSLMVLKESGTPKQQKQAAKILPIVRRHHLLLVTLLLANAAAVEAMPLFLDRVSDPVTAIVVSVSAVLLFGEVFPQALCTRYGLAIGSSLTWLVYLLMALLFVIAWPLSKFLDCLLGKEHGTFFRRAELKALVGLHGPRSDDSESPIDGQATEQLTEDEVCIIKGALDMKFKTVKDAMVSLDHVYMVDLQDKMDGTKMDEILNKSHSRVPVFDRDQSNVIGILLIKCLIKLNPADEIPVSTLVKDRNFFREVPFVKHTKPLFDLLNEFQTGKSHLSIVMRGPEEGEVETASEDGSIRKSEVVGIITLEDIIEELLQEEIIDETDIYVDVARKILVAHAIGAGKPVYQRSISSKSANQRRSYGSVNTDAKAPLLSNDELSDSSSKSQ
ncbi:uncharacterized protein LOC141898671 isoform X1 [Tubulanus polymorphus]|uniref:uncharacterized protein LOC141898671 isoform X1 n=3 Tax=Tubulanus polymorphus TaxID=672921 RepID=UPI003DA6B34D